VLTETRASITNHRYIQRGANRPGWGGESARGRTSQGAKEPWGEPAKGLKSQTPMTLYIKR